MREMLTNCRPDQLPYVRAWLSLSHIIEGFEVQKRRGDTINLGVRADMIAAFRSTEVVLGMDQTIPRRVR